MTEQGLDRHFDDLLVQTQDGGLTYQQIEHNTRYERLQKIKEWKSRHGFTFNIYCNEHLVNGKKHFHFDNKEKAVFAKVDFDGNILEIKDKPIPSNIEKDLKYFLAKPYVRNVLEETWNLKNPTLK